MLPSTNITNSVEYITNCVEPPQMYYYWTYSTNQYIPIEDKTKKSIDVAKMLMEEKLISLKSINSFTDLVDKISKLL